MARVVTSTTLRLGDHGDVGLGLRLVGRDDRELYAHARPPEQRRNEQLGQNLDRRRVGCSLRRLANDDPSDELDVLALEETELDEMVVLLALQAAHLGRIDLGKIGPDLDVHTAKIARG
jgi:hypothetical protein